MVVDGQARVVALGMPRCCATFGDLSHTFVESLLQCGQRFDRIDVTFDRYRSEFIKAEPERNGAIRKLVEDRTTQLPHKGLIF